MLTRVATADDAAAICAIYAPIVERTAISFESGPPSRAQMAQRIERHGATHAFLVAERAGDIVGYAYGSAHRPRDAYRYSAEVSAYVTPSCRRRGVAARLYTALFDALRAKGLANAYAGIALPNDPSVALHERLGFVAIGVFPRVGFKFDQWHDVGWYHRPLTDA